MRTILLKHNSGIMEVRVTKKTALPDGFHAICRAAGMPDETGFPGQDALVGRMVGQQSSRNLTSSMPSEENASVDSSTRSLNSARLCS